VYAIIYVSVSNIDMYQTLKHAFNLKCQWCYIANDTQHRRFEERGKTYLVKKILTIAELLVMNEAKLVGTKPGATQFTRVLGAISAARAYTLYLHNNYQI
jgi:hypothetical protein